MRPHAPAPRAGPVAVSRRFLPVLVLAALPLGGAEPAPDPPPSIRLLGVPTDLHTGLLRVEALTHGTGIETVSFELDGHEVMRKTRPPYSVEVDLGRVPRRHTLAATAFGAAGQELARDETSINAGSHHFAVHLVAPRPGAGAAGTQAIAEVEVPQDQSLDRIEFYRDETLLEVRRTPPFDVSVPPPSGDRPSYLRAVAYLADGRAAEDIAWLAAPPNLERLDVDFVELYTSVADHKGRPVEDLARSEVHVLEDGREQRIRRFERVRDLPIYAAVVLDTSASMAEELAAAESAALRFFREVLRANDRAAVVTFSDQPRLAVPLTHDLDVLAGGLERLVADGETTLWDSIVYTLYYFGGLTGKRAIVVLTDGEDSQSRYRYRDTLEYARRSGVAIYTIGLGPTGRSTESRARLEALARETGGRFFAIDSVADLGWIYRRIQEELHSQYLIAYQSDRPAGGVAFRTVEVDIDRRGLEATTIPGYYP